MEFVMVPVPADRVLEVYALLASGSHSGPDGELRAGEPEDPWDQALLERTYRESPPPMQSLLKYLSLNAGRGVGANELAKEIDRTRQQMAGVLGAFGRRVKNRYRQSTWPFHADWNGAHDMVIYRMDEEKAAMIREAMERR